jgi:transcription elongation factor Elf1
MERTEILCPECMKKKLLTTINDNVNDDKTWCDECGTEFNLKYESHKVWDKRTEELLEKHYTHKLTYI